MKDLISISRQAAIDAVNAYLGLSEVSRTIQNMTSVQEILEQMPSVQPEIIRCKDCRHFDGQELCLKHGFFVGLDLTFFCKSGERIQDDLHGED